MWPRRYGSGEGAGATSFINQVLKQANPPIALRTHRVLLRSEHTTGPLASSPPSLPFCLPCPPTARPAQRGARPKDRRLLAVALTISMASAWSVVCSSGNLVPTRWHTGTLGSESHDFGRWDGQAGAPFTYIHTHIDSTYVWLAQSSIIPGQAGLL